MSAKRSSGETVSGVELESMNGSCFCRELGQLNSRSFAGRLGLRGQARDFLLARVHDILLCRELLDVTQAKRALGPAFPQHGQLFGDPLLLRVGRLLGLPAPLSARVELTRLVPVGDDGAQRLKGV